MISLIKGFFYSWIWIGILINPDVLYKNQRKKDRNNIRQMYFKDL